MEVEHMVCVFSLCEHFGCGLKKGNVENQREHLIFLLANIDSRSRPDEEYSLVMLYFDSRVI